MPSYVTKPSYYTLYTPLQPYIHLRTPVIHVYTTIYTPNTSRNTPLYALHTPYIYALNTPPHDRYRDWTIPLFGPNVIYDNREQFVEQRDMIKNIVHTGEEERSLPCVLVCVVVCCCVLCAVCCVLCAVCCALCAVRSALCCCVLCTESGAVCCALCCIMYAVCCAPLCAVSCAG